MLERGQQQLRRQPRASGALKKTEQGGQKPLFSRSRSVLVLFPPILAIPLLLWFLTLGFGQQVDSNGEAAEAVRGTVVNKLTHEPIGRALVYSPDNRYATLTDGEGHFEFKVPKQASPRPDSSARFMSARGDPVSGGPYSLMAKKPGFLEDPVSREMPNSPGLDTTIVLLPEAIIEGRILVSSGEPTSGITVQLFHRQISDGRSHWMGQTMAQTNSKGEFRFAELGPGEYKIMTHEQLDRDPEAFGAGAPLYGFPPSCFPGVPDFQSGATIHLAMGQTFDGSVALIRQPYFPVRIPVSGVDLDSGANITVLAQGHPGPGYSLGYNPNQHAIVGLLPSGTYLIQARAFGGSQTSGTVSITVAGRELDGPTMAIVPATPIPVHVKEEFSSANQSLTGMLTPTWRDRGRTYRLEGPRAYLQVYLEPAEDFAGPGGGVMRPPTGPDDQALKITNAFPGRYWVHVESSRGYAASVTSGDLDLRQNPLVISPGANSPIEITVRDDGATVEGRVAGGAEEARPTDGSLPRSMHVVRRAWILCLPIPGSTGRFQQFPALLTESKFRSPVMAPGAYRVLAFEGPRPELEYRDAEAMRPYETLGQIVNLTAGETVHLELQAIGGVE